MLTRRHSTKIVDCTKLLLKMAYDLSSVPKFQGKIPLFGEQTYLHLPMHWQTLQKDIDAAGLTVALEQRHKRELLAENSEADFKDPSTAGEKFGIQQAEFVEAWTLRGKLPGQPTENVSKPGKGRTWAKSHPHLR